MKQFPWWVVVPLVAFVFALALAGHVIHEDYKLRGLRVQADVQKYSIDARVRLERPDNSF